MNPSTPDNFFDKLRGRSWYFGVFAVILVILNFAWDYYHPLGILFDIVILAALFVRYLNAV